MVARLISKGISLKEVHSYIETTKSLKSIETLKLMLNSLESYWNGKVLFTFYLLLVLIKMVVLVELMNFLYDFEQC